MKMKKSFYNQNTIKVAESLLGKYLVNNNVVGKIVETEAYLSDDPASHSSKGKTKRNEKMFGPPGSAYIYLIYGVHSCFNVVTRPEGIGEAVLIRALEPISGINLMKKRRKTNKIKNLCSGPGKLTSSMGISKEHNGASLMEGNLRIVDKKSKHEIISTKRIGITKGADLNYRFYIRGNEFVSRR